jgi:chromosome segregation ATPase
MPSSELVTRGALARRLAVNAATKPLNVAVLGGLIVAGIALNLVVVVGAIAIVAYLVLVALTFFDSEEAERVGNELYAGRRGSARDQLAPALDLATLEPRIAAVVQQARETAAGIRDAIAQADHPFDDVAADVDALVAAMDTSARRAQLISSTLAGQARAGQDVAGLERAIADLRGRADDADVRALVADLEAQRDATARLEERLERFEVGMRRICASLGLLRTRLVEMSASEEEAAQRELARQSRELRERTDLLAEAMAEVFADDEGQQVELPVAERPGER